MITFDGKQYEYLNGTRFHFSYQPWRDAYALTIQGEDGGRVRVSAIQLQTEQFDHASIAPLDPLQFSSEEAQQLMDALWQSGLRPSSGEGHTAHIQALHTNLNDLRTILFHKLGIANKS